MNNILKFWFIKCKSAFVWLNQHKLRVLMIVILSPILFWVAIMAVFAVLFGYCLNGKADWSLITDEFKQITKKVED